MRVAGRITIHAASASTHSLIIRRSNLQVYHAKTFTLEVLVSRPLRVIVEQVIKSAHEDRTVALSADRLSIDEHGTLFVQWDGGSQFFGNATWGKVIVERVADK